MIDANSSSNKKALGIFLFALIILVCLPATLYGALWCVAKVASATDARAVPRMPALENFFALCWFVVILAGRPMCALAVLLDAILVLMRDVSVLQRILASILVIFAVLGTLLIESQAGHVRH